MAVIVAFANDVAAGANVRAAVGTRVSMSGVSCEFDETPAITSAAEAGFDDSSVINNGVSGSCVGRASTT